MTGSRASIIMPMPALAAITGALSCLVVSYLYFLNTRSFKSPSLELGIAGGVKKSMAQSPAFGRLPSFVSGARAGFGNSLERLGYVYVLAHQVPASRRRLDTTDGESESPSSRLHLVIAQASCASTTWMMLWVSVCTVMSVQHERHISSASCPLSSPSKQTSETHCSQY